MTLPRSAAQSLLPPTEDLLVSGGDERLALDPSSGANRYGCAPRPDAGLLDFASSTASVISPRGQAAAEALRRRLALGIERRGTIRTYERALGRLQGELAALLGTHDLPGLDILVSPSGTDLHALALALCRNSQGRALTIILPEAAETGSGVPAALSGPGLRMVHPLKAGAPELRQVPIREPDGQPRSTADVDAECSALAEQAIAEGRQVLLVVLDVSKTGLRAPSRAAAIELERRFPDRLTLLVDACQARLSRASLRRWLEQGALVALTGSKFFAGPAFSGALLVPACRQTGMAEIPPLADGQPNFGLLLRWEAALAELRLFAALPDAAVAACLTEFSTAMLQRLEQDAAFDPVLPPARPAGAREWDDVPGILPFRLRDTAGQFLDMAAVSALYKALPRDLSGPGKPFSGVRCRLGQPVPCGTEGAALRLCLSSRQIVSAIAAGSAAELVTQAHAILDKTALLARSLAKAI